MVDERAANNVHTHSNDDFDLCDPAKWSRTQQKHHSHVSGLPSLSRRSRLGSSGCGFWNTMLLKCYRASEYVRSHVSVVSSVPSVPGPQTAAVSPSCASCYALLHACFVLPLHVPRIRCMLTATRQIGLRLAPMPPTRSLNSVPETQGLYSIHPYCRSKYRCVTLVAPPGLTRMQWARL